MSTCPEPAEGDEQAAGGSRAARQAGRLIGRSVVKAKAAMASPAVRAAGKKAASAAATRYSASARGRAGKLLRNKDKLLSLARRGDDVVGGMETEATAGLAGEARALLRLIRAYATGAYRDVPFETMVPVVAAVVYVVSPLDVIPDFIPGAGSLDDVTVLTYALKAVRGELDKFLAWERQAGFAPKPPAAFDEGPG